MKQETITKLANYLNMKFTHPNREYEKPRGTTIYTSRHIAPPIISDPMPQATGTDQDEHPIKTASDGINADPLVLGMAGTAALGGLGLIQKRDKQKQAEMLAELYEMVKGFKK